MSGYMQTEHSTKHNEKCLTVHCTQSTSIQYTGHTVYKVAETLKYITFVDLISSNCVNQLVYNDSIG